MKPLDRLFLRMEVKPLICVAVFIVTVFVGIYLVNSEYYDWAVFDLGAMLISILLFTEYDCKVKRALHFLDENKK